MSLKMRINNEEVLCNKEFTIKEEMLNTSSTILNNCYPKEWEEDKDYTTRFYYPQDYSKCEISDEVEPQEVIGNETTIINDKDYDLNNLIISGNLEQQTYEGNNLNFTPYANGTRKTTNGITFTVNDKGEIIANGTATANAYFYMHAPNLTPYWYLPKNKYYVTGCPSGGGSSTYQLGFRLYNNQTNVKAVVDNGNGAILDSTPYTYDRLLFFALVVSGTTCNNLVFKPMVSTKTSIPFEPYVGGIPSPSPDYPQNIKVIDGIITNKIINNNSEETIIQYDLQNNFLAKIGNIFDTLDEISGVLNKKIGKIESYNGETITTDYVSTTGQLTTGATVYYVLENPEVIQLTPVKIPLYKGINNFKLENDTINKFQYQLYKLIFAGIVENTGNISLRPEDAKFCSLQILDFKTFLSEGETLDFVINGKTIEEAIEMVVNASVDYGVVLGNINILNGNDMIGAYSTLDKTPYDVLQYLADISQSRWTTRRINNNLIAIDFYDPTLMPKGEAIEYTKEWFCKNQIMNLSFNYSSRDYRNKQVMTSNKVFADITYTEIIRGDGFNNTYTVNEQIGEIIGITINGEEKTFTTNINKELGESADFYYSVESNIITSDDILASGTEIRIIYIPLLQGRQVIRNVNEINRIGNLLNRKGVISRYENRNDATSSEELLKIGQSYIKYKGIPEINLNVQTQNDIWNVGSVVYFNAPIKELQQEYMVKTKELRYLSSVNKIFYTYVLTSSFNSETEINYFDNQRSKSAGNLKEGQFINRNMDIESELLIIFDNLSIEEA